MGQVATARAADVRRTIETASALAASKSSGRGRTRVSEEESVKEDKRWHKGRVGGHY